MGSAKGERGIVMKNTILVISLTSLLSGCVGLGGGVGGVMGHSLGRQKLMDFAHKNHISFACAEKENRKLFLGIMLDSNKELIVERCKFSNARENYHAK